MFSNVINTKYFFSILCTEEFNHTKPLTLNQSFSFYTDFKPASQLSIIEHTCTTEQCTC